MGGETGESEEDSSTRPCRTRRRSVSQASTPVTTASIVDTGGRKRTCEEMEQLLAAEKARANDAEERADRTQRELGATKRRLRRSKERNVTCRKALSRAKGDRLTHTWGVRADGTVARLYSVNIARTGKRKAIDDQYVRQSGALKRRKGIGGLEYNLTELIKAHREIQAEGLGSRATLAQRRSNDAHARAKEVRIMVPDTEKCRRGLDGPIDPFPRPCEQVMRQFQLAANLVVFRTVPDIAANANSITPSADGKAFGVHHTLGCVTDFLTMEEAAKDAFGQIHFEPAKRSLCLPLQEVANKIASDVLDKDGALHTLVTPLAFGVMSTLANLDEVFVSEGAKITTALDGAADNRGQGNLQRAMDAMCSEGSILHCATVQRTMWAEAREKIQSVGLYGPLKRFYRGALGGSYNLRFLMLQLRARRKRLREERELADRERLQEKKDAQRAAAEAATLASDAEREADALLSAATETAHKARHLAWQVSQSKTPDVSLTQTAENVKKEAAEANTKAEDAKNKAAEARKEAREAKRRVRELTRRRAKNVPETVRPAGGVSTAQAAGDAPAAAAADNTLQVAPVAATAPVAANAPAAAADNAAHAPPAVPVTAGDAPGSAADDAPIPAGVDPADAAASEPADNLDTLGAYELPAALRPRQPPIRLDVSGAVLKCPEAMERLFKRTMYEKLLRPVLKFERFLRWFMRLWYCTAQGASLIKAQIRALKEWKRSTASHGESGSTIVTEPGPGSVRERSTELDLELVLKGLSELDQSLVLARIDQLFDFQIKKSNGVNERIVWCKLERDPRFGDRREQAMALGRRARIKRCDDWGRSIYGSEWRLAGAELVESWESCKLLGESRSINGSADADAGPLRYRDAFLLTQPSLHRHVSSQLIQERLTQERNFWSSLRRVVRLDDWNLVWRDCDREQREQYWADANTVLESQDGSVLKNALLCANEFRSKFWSKRPKIAHHGVSMDANPARFWGCFDQRLQDERGQPMQDDTGKPIIQETGISVQCISHRQHNSSYRMLPVLDREFMDMLVSLATYIHNDNVKRHVISNAKNFVFPNHKVDEQTTMYSDCRKIVDETALLTNPGGQPKGFSMQQIAASVDPVKGIDPPQTSAMVRWATVCKTGASLAGMPADIMAFGVGRKGGFGKTPEDESRALASIFSERGFVSEDHQNWVLSSQAGPFFKFLVDPRSKAQISVVRFLSKVVVDPLLAIASEPNLCSKHTMGMGSFPRALLRILSDKVWTNTGHRRRPARVGHRVDPAGTEWASGSWINKRGSLRLLNPKCGQTVRLELAAVFDEDWHPDIQQDIVTAVEVLLSQFQRIAAMHGPAIPDTTREIFAALHPHLYSDDDSKGLVNKSRHAMEETFPVKMSQLVFMFKLNMLQVITEIKDANRRELQSLDSFAGGMEQTEWTRQTVNGARILRARAWALADAVVVKVMGRDVLAHFKAKFSRSGSLAGRDPLDFFPGFASLWGRHRKLVDAFSGVEEPETERARGRDDAVVDESDDDDRVIPCVRPPPAHYNSVAALNARDPDGRHIVFVDANDMFAKPLSAFPDAQRAAQRAALLSNSSVRVERPWSRMQQKQSTSPGSNMMSLCLWFMSHNDVTMGVDLEKLDTELLEAALELARHDGWKKLFELDEVVRDVMNADYKNQQAAKSGAKFWSKTNHDGSYRTKRWLTYTPKERKAMDRKIMGLKLRLGLEVPAKPQRPRRRRGDGGGPAASRPAAARQQTNAGQAAAAADASGSGMAAVSDRDTPVDEGAADFERPDDNLPDVSACEDEQAESANLLSKTSAESEPPAIRRSARLAYAGSEGATGESREYRFTDADNAENGADYGETMSSVVGAAAPVDEGLPAAAGAVAEDAETAAPGTGDAVGSAEASAAVSSAPVGKGLPAAAAAAATEDSEMAAPGSAPGTGDAVGNAEALSAAAADDAEESGSGSDSGAASEPEEASEPETDMDSPESDSERFADVEVRKEDVWRVEFCRDVFTAATPRHPRHQNNVWLPSEVSFSANHGSLVAVVTRRPSERVKRLLKELEIPISDVSIKFTVEKNSTNLCYIRFNDYAGLQLVRIESIRRPKPDPGRGKDPWAGTFDYRRLMTTGEAIEDCDQDTDSNGCLGRKSLRGILKADEARNRTTYHQGACIYCDGDLRQLIGVVRWHPATTEPNMQHHKEYPQSDLFRMGGHAHEQT